MAEMRLIDANALNLRDRVIMDMGGMCFIEDVETAIEETPTVDAVPVVRCKDCVFLNKRLIVKKRGVHCLTWNQIVNPDNGYCNWGRRSDDD